ncbi:protein-lysine methyltransferase METTL21C-like isoform X1 [Zingiber officinale]|nr:protein-lysine methyltransferase METTL21C-like isoform X1 [Zingiber officinale]
MDVALFSPAALFHDDDDDDDDDIINEACHAAAEGKESPDQQDIHVERIHSFPGADLIIREFSFHQLNANLLWPGTFAFSNWLVENQSLLQGTRILEIGSGTGALAIFLRRSFGVDITTSDFDDTEIEGNIAYNCRANGLPALPHIRHTWGDKFPTSEPDWDMIIASDILLYVKQYPNLIRTLCFLLNNYKPKENVSDGIVLPISGKEVKLLWPFFLMSWRRRLGGEEKLFFKGCEDAGLTVYDAGARVYCISGKKIA